MAALCYSELASMVPVAGSAYTYTYAVVGELMAWMVGWALILEYAVGASAVAVGWSNHAVGLLHGLGVDFPAAISNADALMAKVRDCCSAPRRRRPADGAASRRLDQCARRSLISAAVTWLLIIGTTESARVNAVLVLIKIAALTLFIALTIPVMHAEEFHALRAHRREPACSAPPPRSSSPMSASTRFPPPPRKPAIRSATFPSA